MSFSRYILKENKTEYQLLIDHINGVLNRVDNYSKDTVFNETMKLISFSHDLGKISNYWQDFLLTGTNRVQHSTTGIYVIEDYLKKAKESTDRLTYTIIRDIVQYVIGAHHGLFDNINDEGKFSLDIKLDSYKSNDNIEEDFVQIFDVISEEEFEKKLFNSIKEMEYFADSLKNISSKEAYNRFYYIGVITRVLLSMQIDGDWSDAANFEYDLEGKYDSKFEGFKWDEIVNDYEEYIKQNLTSKSPINILRTQISNECFKNSERDTGIYRLSVPTGGGKTIAAMRFALHHAKNHNSDRIFYIAPFNSILEQNADVYKGILKEKSDKYILEHHSNVIRKRNKKDNDDLEENKYGSKEEYKYLTEKWTAPIILTSMVQLLNAFFSGDKKAIRRLHRLKNSVVIIDEMQALPFKTITIFNSFINAMAKYFGTTFVLCTATQPPYEDIMGSDDAEKKTAPIIFSPNRELVSNYEDRAEFKRVKIIDKTKVKPYNLEEIYALIVQESKDTDSMMLIANTRSVVEKIFNYIENQDSLKDYEIVMLSNNMCPAQRLDAIDSMKIRLKNGEKIIVISTPLVEAGVDISMNKVIRSITGIDSIAQSAGRCNRNGEMNMGYVYIINIDQKLENLSMLEEIKIAQEVAHAILSDFKDNSEKYGNNLLSNEAIKFYFEQLHKKLSSKTHYTTKEGYTLYDLLGNGNAMMEFVKKYNKDNVDSRILRQSFFTAGKEFKAIDDLATGVVVSYGEGSNLVNELLSCSTHISRIKEILSEIQRFTVGVYSNVLQELKDKNALIYIEEYDIYVLANMSFYDMKRGLTLKEGSLETYTL